MALTKTFTAIRPLYAVALTCTALVLGLTLSHVLQAPGSRGLDGAAWLQVQHTFYGGFAIIGGAAEIVGLAVSIALTAQLARYRWRAVFAPLLAALGLLGTLLAYWFGNRPVNALVAGWTSTSLPADWSSYRDTWEVAHAVSAGLAAIAFLALLTLLWYPMTARRTLDG